MLLHVKHPLATPTASKHHQCTETTTIFQSWSDHTLACSQGKPRVFTTHPSLTAGALLAVMFRKAPPEAGLRMEGAVPDAELKETKFNQNELVDVG